MSAGEMAPEEAVIGYHEATKHHPNRFARSLGYLDWANQPNPFRRYVGAREAALPLDAPGAGPGYAALFGLDDVGPAAVGTESIGALFRYALGLAAWKSAGGERWALRCNPSSGNLHPTEGYLLCGAIHGLSDAPGLYHYAPDRHALEHRAAVPQAVWDRLIAPCPPGAFLVGLTSIVWREAWKYGERAYRYCQHDAGHALAAFRFSAATLGWRLRLLSDLGDEAAARVLGVASADRSYVPSGVLPEPEWPDLIAAVVPAKQAAPVGVDVAAVPTGGWEGLSGKANRLSAEHVHWPVIDLVEQACARPEPGAAAVASGTGEGEADRCVAGVAHVSPVGMSARDVILRRRSAQAMDGRASLSRERFYEMLARTVPACTPAPWDMLDGPPRVHLALFVHRVRGLESGLYMLVRDPRARDALRAAMHPRFAWSAPPRCPDELGLHLLEAGDPRRFAGEASCGQAIASDGVFAAAMLAEFEPVLREEGPWRYRRLHWEAGAIGQTLYLEAEAAGLRGTGIGCYFDDVVHKRLGLADRAFQSVYHFTVGGPVEDARLTTLPPYPDV